MNARSKTPTINDVAKLARVSKRTVSRVINRSEKVNAETRAKVQAIIEQLHYSPNRQARGLAARRSFLLGLIYDAPTLFINNVQEGILSVCSNAGYELVVHTCHVNNEHLIDNVAHFIDNAKLDGVVILPPISEVGGLAEMLDYADCPFVRFTSELDGEPWKQVVTNYMPAITDMTTHLVQLGHQHFGFISGPKHNVSSRVRQESFIQALARYNLKLPKKHIAEGAFTYESGLRAGRRLLSQTPRPTAIFAANDEMAFGVMNVADELGIKIPHDLSLVGFDGTPFSSFVIPALSTIRRQTDEMAKLATQKLLALIEQGPDAVRTFETMVSPQFVPRKSTGPATTG